MKLLLLLIFTSFSSLQFAQTSLQYRAKPFDRIIKSYDSTSCENINMYNISGHSFSNIAFQVAASPVIAFAVVIPPLTASAGLNGNNENKVKAGAISLFLYTCYTFGISAGIHLIAKIENPDNSLKKTFFYAAAGAGAGIAASFVWSKFNRNSWGIPLAIGPMAGALVYSLFLAEWPEYGKPSANSLNNSNAGFIEDKFYSHKDYIRCTMLFNFDLMKLYFP